MSRTAMLSDEMWARIEPVMPDSLGRPGRDFRDHRQVVEGILYRLRTGVPWRDLPSEFGPWQTVWKRHARFAKDGTWDRLMTQVQAEADAAGELDWKVSVDSTVVRVHQHGANAKRVDSGADADGLAPPEELTSEPAAASAAAAPEDVASARSLTGGTIELQDFP